RRHSPTASVSNAEPIRQQAHADMERPAGPRLPVAVQNRLNAGHLDQFRNCSHRNQRHCLRLRYPRRRPATLLSNCFVAISSIARNEDDQATHEPMRACTTNLFLLPALTASLGLMLAGRVTAQTFTTLYSFTAVDTNTGANS